MSFSDRVIDLTQSRRDMDDPELRRYIIEELEQYEHRLRRKRQLEVQATATDAGRHAIKDVPFNATATDHLSWFCHAIKGRQVKATAADASRHAIKEPFKTTATDASRHAIAEPTLKTTDAELFDRYHMEKRQRTTATDASRNAIAEPTLKATDAELFDRYHMEKTTDDDLLEQAHRDHSTDTSYSLTSSLFDDIVEGCFELEEGELSALLFGSQEF